MVSLNFNPYITNAKFQKPSFGAKPSDNDDKNKDNFFCTNHERYGDDCYINGKKVSEEEYNKVAQGDIDEKVFKNFLDLFNIRKDIPIVGNKVGSTGELQQKKGLLKGQTDPDTYKNFHYSDLAGIDSTIKEIKNAVENPIKHPSFYERFNLTPNRNILLFGPPGCGKTTIARAIANECNANLFMLNGAELQDKYIGETERKMREVFKNAEKVEPAIIFIDECDSLAPQRGNNESSMYKNDYTNQLLSLIDNLKKNKKNVFVIMATNYPQLLDKAVVRKGRMDKHIKMCYPDKDGLNAILKLKMEKKPYDEAIDFESIIKTCYKLKASGADVEAVVYDACSNAFARALSKNPVVAEEEIKKLKLTQGDFEIALKNLAISKKSLKSKF